MDWMKPPTELPIGGFSINVNPPLIKNGGSYTKKIQSTYVNPYRVGGFFLGRNGL